MIILVNRLNETCLDHLDNRGINRDVAFYLSSANSNENETIPEPTPKDAMYEALCREEQKVNDIDGIYIKQIMITDSVIIEVYDIICFLLSENRKKVP